jgi:hypothetical protein
VIRCEWTEFSWWCDTCQVGFAAAALERHVWPPEQARCPGCGGERSLSTRKLDYAIQVQLERVRRLTVEAARPQRLDPHRIHQLLGGGQMNLGPPTRELVANLALNHTQPEGVQTHTPRGRRLELEAVVE